MSGDWSDYDKLVIHQLDKHSELLDALDRRIRQNEIEMAVLKTKASILSAGVAVAITVVVKGLEVLLQS